MLVRHGVFFYLNMSCQRAAWKVNHETWQWIWVVLMLGVSSKVSCVGVARDRLGWRWLAECGDASGVLVGWGYYLRNILMSRKGGVAVYSKCLGAAVSGSVSHTIWPKALLLVAIQKLLYCFRDCEQSYILLPLNNFTLCSTQLSL